MTHGLTYNDEERDARRAARTAKIIARNDRRRMAVLAYVAMCPQGTQGVVSLAPELRLRELERRGLVERRWVITPAGRRKLAEEA